MAKKKTPVSVSDLAAETLTGVDEVVNFGERIARYGQARTRAVGMLDHLRDEDSPEATKAAAGLATCGNYLHFREYYTVGKVRLHSARFCKQHLICPMCAIRRGSKALGAYLDRWEVIREERPELRAYLITLTVKNGDDLEERQEHLTGSLRTLMHRRRDFNAGTRGAPWTELCNVEGAVYTLELTQKGKGWHPHCHMIALCSSEPCQEALSEEWKAITGDSFIVDVRPLSAFQDPAEGFMEVFKYAVKFSDLSLADNWHAAQVLKGKRLLNSFGLFRGVDVPESLLDEPLDNLPYWDRFYRYMNGIYQLTDESPKAKDQPRDDAGDLKNRSYVVTKPADLSQVKGGAAGLQPSPLTHSEQKTLQRSALRPTGSERTRPAGGS
ncbi:protein rep [Pseudomonas sp. MAG002Y]|uniref:protein rep n=1 Tax=Pseudomonas sp. MAG002Y TaxID=2678690 RepID=UPI001C60AE17|nr:protein rep [Pseudomonas sp. MAG002Y]